MNSKRSSIVSVMTLIISFLVLFASLDGIFNKSLYEDVLRAGTITKTLVIGSIAQDIISIPLAVVLGVLSIIYLRRQGYKTFITILGIIGNFFYGYGLYVIQGQYTSIYPVYLAIFSLSIYSLIFGISSFDLNIVKNYTLTKSLRISIAIFMMIIIFILAPGWLLKMMPGIQSHVPDSTYGVFILDLCIVFPALGYIIVQLIRNNSFAITLAGIALYKIFTVCLSWGFAQWFVSFYDYSKLEVGMTAISSVLTAISLIFIVIYMYKLKVGEVVNG